MTWKMTVRAVAGSALVVVVALSGCGGEDRFAEGDALELESDCSGSGAVLEVAPGTLRLESIAGEPGLGYVLVSNQGYSRLCFDARSTLRFTPDSPSLTASGPSVGGDAVSQLEPGEAALVTVTYASEVQEATSAVLEVGSLNGGSADIGLELVGRGGAPASLVEASQRFAELLCGLMFDCCTESEIRMFTWSNWYGPVSSMAECLDLYGLRPEEILSVEASIEAGRMGYDRVAAQSCLAKLEVRSCGSFEGRQVPAACDAMFLPLTPIGEPCSLIGDCRGGSCEGSAGGSELLCAPKAQAGAHCSSRASCEDSLACVSTWITPSVLALTCQRLGEGQCSINSDCATGLCDPFESVPISSCLDVTGLCDGLE